MKESPAAEHEFMKDTIERVVPSIIDGDQITRNEVNKSRLLQGIPAYISLLAGRAGVMPEIKVVQTSPLEAARALHTDHPRQDIAILNIAHAHSPAGALPLTNPSTLSERTEEQILCLQTTLYPTLLPMFYPILDTEIIYSPNCLVFRDSENKVLKLEDRFYINVLTCPEISNPKLTKKGVYTKAHRDLLIEKFRLVLRVVALMNTAILVLGPFGCSDNASEEGRIEDAIRCFVQVYQDNNENFDTIEQIVFTLKSDQHKEVFTRVLDESKIEHR